MSLDSSFCNQKLLLLLHCQVNFRTLYYYFALTDNFLKLGGLSVTEAHTKVQIGTQKNGECQKCEMVDYSYSVAIQANSFHNNKIIWIKRFGRLTGAD